MLIRMPKNDLEKIHEHHIIPKYKCEELGIDKDFTGNTIYLTRLEHAWIHWWMWCNEKKDVYNLLESKGVDLEGIQMPNSTGCIKNHIPWHDRNDSGAAGVVGLGQIDGIDQTGENNSMYIDGRCMGENWWREYGKGYRQIPEVIARRNALRQRPEARAKRLAYKQRTEVKARRKEIDQSPEGKKKISISNRKYRLSKKHPILDMFSGAIL